MRRLLATCAVLVVIIAGCSPQHTTPAADEPGRDGVSIEYRDIAVSVPDAWSIVRFRGEETDCKGTAAGTAFVGAPPDSESCNLANLDGPSLWLLDLQPNPERDDAPTIHVGGLDGRLWVDEEDRVGVAFPDAGVYLLVSRSAESLLESVHTAR